MHTYHSYGTRDSGRPDRGPDAVFTMVIISGTADAHAGQVNRAPDEYVALASALVHNPRLMQTLEM